MIAFVYPGQGAETPGMGLWMESDHRPQFATLMAGGVAGVDALQLLRRGGPAWTRTAAIQPLLVATCIATTSVLAKKGVRPHVVAGHSVGEVSAWCAAGVLGDIHAIALAGARGMAMEGVEGGMIAVDGDASVRDAALAAGNEAGTLVVAAHNRPERWILSGDEAALAAALAVVPGTRVPVSGPWHSPLMAGAAATLADVFGAFDAPVGELPVISGATGERATSMTASLAAQLTGPVQWVAVLRRLEAMGVTDVVTVGPGKTLRAQLRDTVPELRVHGSENAKEVDATAEALRG